MYFIYADKVNNVNNTVAKLLRFTMFDNYHPKFLVLKNNKSRFPLKTQK